MHYDDICHVDLNHRLALIKSQYWFLKMTRFIRKYVAACLYCTHEKDNYVKKEDCLYPISKPSDDTMRMAQIDNMMPFCRKSKGHQP